MMDVGNNNLYGYAGGNPISNSDPDGHFWGKLWDKAKSVGNAVVSGAKEVYNTVASGVKQAYNTVKSGVKKVYNKVKSGVKKVYNKVKKVAKKVYNTVKKAYHKVKKTVKKIVNKVKNVVKKVVKPAVKKIVNNVKKATQSATKSVSQFIRGASDRINSNIFTLGLADLSDPNEEKGVAYHVGAVAGDIVSMLVGVSATVGGGGGVVVACGTTACAAAAPGAVAAAWGTGVAGGGAKNLGQDIGELINMFSGKGKGTSIPTPGDVTPGGRTFTKHAAERANQRGYSSKDVDDIIDDWTNKGYQPGGRTVYGKRKKDGYHVVVLDSSENIVSIVGGGKGSNTLPDWNAVQKMMRNQGGFSDSPW